MPTAYAVLGRIGLRIEGVLNPVYFDIRRTMTNAYESV